MRRGVCEDEEPKGFVEERKVGEEGIVVVGGGEERSVSAAQQES